MLEEYETICVITLLQDCIDRLHILGRILPIPMATDEQKGSIAKENPDSDAGKKQTGRQPSRHELFPKSLMNQIQTKVSYDEDAFKLQKDRSFIESSVSKVIIELQCSGGYISLIETNQEEFNRKQDILQTFHNEESMQRRLRDLLSMLIFIRGDREEQATQFQESIFDLNDTMQESKVKTYLEEKYVTNQTQAAIQQGVLRYQNEEKDMFRQVDRMRRKINEENRINQEIEMYVRQNLDFLEQKMEYWMEKYEKHTESKDRQIDILQQERHSINNRLTEIELLSAEYSSVIQSDRDERMMARAKLQEQEKRKEAVITIQKFWRGVMVRKFLGPFKKLKLFLMKRKKEVRKKK